MATFAPSAARRLAIAAPMPREPPVTNAALLVKLDTCISFASCERVIRHLPDFRNCHRLALRGKGLIRTSVLLVKRRWNSRIESLVFTGLAAECGQICTINGNLPSA